MSKSVEVGLGPVKRGPRGFEIVRFNDLYRASCSLQASSLADESAIWLGCDEADPKILEHGKGWVPYPIPEEVLLTTRMHLNRKQVAALITHLQSWLDADTFKPHVLKQ